MCEASQPLWGSVIVPVAAGCDAGDASDLACCVVAWMCSTEWDAKAPEPYLDVEVLVQVKHFTEKVMLGWQH